MPSFCTYTTLFGSWEQTKIISTTGIRNMWLSFGIPSAWSLRHLLLLQGDNEWTVLSFRLWLAAYTGLFHLVPSSPTKLQGSKRKVSMCSWGDASLNEPLYCGTIHSRKLLALVNFVWLNNDICMKTFNYPLHSHLYPLFLSRKLLSPCERAGPITKLQHCNMGSP